MFSKAEIKLLKVLGRRKMTIQDLTHDYFMDHKMPLPMEPNNYIGSALRRIMKKCDFNKLDWTIEGKGAGSHGKTVWKAKRSE